MMNEIRITAEFLSFSGGVQVSKLNIRQAESFLFHFFPSEMKVSEENAVEDAFYD